MINIRSIKVIGIAFIIGLFFALPSILNSLYWTHVLILTLINVLLAVSLRALTRTGQISMGTAGFLLLGAYTSSLLALKAGLPFWITMPLGGLLAALVALAVGYPFLRAKGIYFAILTLMLAEVWRLIAWYWSSMTGGSAGLLNIPSPSPINLLGLTVLNFDSKSAYYYLTLTIVVICLVILYRIERSWLGLMWSSINESDVLARAVGVNIMGHKMLIFVVSSFFMGIGGALYAHYMGNIAAYNSIGSPFSFTASVYTLIYVVAGGEASFFGPITGALIFTILGQVVRNVQQYMPLIYGAIFIFVVFVMPQGIMGLGPQLSQLFSKMIKWYPFKQNQKIKNRVNEN